MDPAERNVGRAAVLSLSGRRECEGRLGKSPADQPRGGVPCNAPKNRQGKRTWSARVIRGAINMEWVLSHRLFLGKVRQTDRFGGAARKSGNRIGSGSVVLSTSKRPSHAPSLSPASRSSDRRDARGGYCRRRTRRCRRGHVPAGRFDGDAAALLEVSTRFWGACPLLAPLLSSTQRSIRARRAQLRSRTADVISSRTHVSG